jgi:hypothetical protein
VKILMHSSTEYAEVFASISSFSAPSAPLW